MASRDGRIPGDAKQDREQGQEGLPGVRQRRVAKSAEIIPGSGDNVPIQFK